MAYEGKFVDRSPCIRPAGHVTFRKGENVVNCMIHDVNENESRQTFHKSSVLDYKLPPPRTNIYQGFYSDMRECLQPETDLGLFGTLEKEFKDTVYDSYWKKEVGRVPDPSPMLPAGMDHKEVCFGKPTPAISLAGEIINPPKMYVDVIIESLQGHDLYKKTHQDYEPGEQINRNYVDPFNREYFYGTPTPCDPNGGCIKKVMNTDVEENRFVSKILADHKKLTESIIGKVHAPNNNISCVPKGHAFGKRNRKPLYSVAELLKDSNPNLEKVHLHQEISHINVLRNRIAKIQPPFPHRDFVNQLRKCDVEKTGLIHLEEAYNILKEFGIFPDRSIFEDLLSRLDILTSEKMIAYEVMADLLNTNIVFPEIKKIHDVPNEFLSFETISQKAHRYHENPDAIKITKDIPVAGVPPKQYYPIDSLIRPAHFTHYFLEAKDFFVSRTSEYFKEILSRLGCEIDQKKFNKIWNNAQDKNGCVSVNSFLKALNDNR